MNQARLFSTCLFGLGLFGALAVSIPRRSAAQTTSASGDVQTIPLINGRPLVNTSDDASDYQTVDGRPLKQPISGTTAPQPSLFDKIGTSTKNFFKRVGNLFSSTPADGSTNSSFGIKRPSTAASNNSINSADTINLNGSQIPIGYNADGTKR
ncbi:MAG TPA: hypothetical protein VFE24_05270 [Pirellulales bacterium]|jgi:hypothetical protein|nr:hypothetical protein [Pirellulales bacterium]